MPEARVFRPRSEDEDKLIETAMQFHVAAGHIEKASWTMYVAFLVNQDVTAIRTDYRERVGISPAGS